MIAKLKGLLDETGADWAVIDVGGVGYLVHCSSKTLAALGERGEACTVYTDLQVSETDMRLLGFAEGAERDWFRLLTQVQGVGSKVALAILSALSIGEVQAACAKGDAAMIARASVVLPVPSVPVSAITSPGASFSAIRCPKASIAARSGKAKAIVMAG